MNMRCNDTRELIGAYIDGELDLVRSLDIEGHLHECSACSREYEEHRTLHRAIREGGLYFEVPETLQKRVIRGLGRRNERPARILPWSWSWPWAIAEAAIVAVVLIVLIVSLIPRAGSSGTLLARDLVSSHVRSLQGHQTDVENDDRHTVKPWFNGRLDFSPPVPDLADSGFTLKGGRLDYVDGRPVAVVVYHRRLHIINLYIWPSNSRPTASEESTAQQGYNLVHWVKNGMTYWAISDLNAAELLDFAKAQQKE